MLKAVKILRSSSSFRCVPLSHRLKKPHADLPLISRNPVKAAPESFYSTSPRTDSLAFQFLNGCGFRAFQMAYTHSESTPAGASSSASTAVQSNSDALKINFCQWCGGQMKYEIPDGEDKMRAICSQCGKITYQNPKMVVGCIVEHENKILLCRPKIMPPYGRWTLPAGYMKIGESAAQGAIRETLEHANAEVDIVSPFAFLDIPLTGHNYLIFLAKLKSPHFSPCPERFKRKQLFALEKIPLFSLASSSTLVTLKMYIEDRKVGSLKFHYGVITEGKWYLTNIHDCTLDHHLKC